MPDMIPKPPADQACRQTAQADCRVVPTDCAGMERLRYMVARQCLAHSAVYSLIEPIKYEEHADERDTPSQSKAKVGNEENRDRRRQEVSPAESVGQESRRVRDQCSH